MPFPTVEEVRAAVEKQLHEGLAGMPGDWIASLPGGKEVEFRPSEGGVIGVYLSLDDEELDAEKSYTFRVRVEVVEG
jgi:hypothetical protein